MELAGLLDITIKRGGTFTLPLDYSDAQGVVDLTGATARMQVRRSEADPTVLLELSTENSGIVIDAAAGTVTLHLSDEATAALAWTKGEYDIFLHYSNGDTDPLLEGRITVSREVTR